ncbi:MAG TPA: 30S ribosomal protein S12 methylthiotransferase RimO [Spirochaetales bacterium]|nr:30S ribosomal protein S12 methylthiotransferase RimO [Spirochaetales bacterium]
MTRRVDRHGSSSFLIINIVGTKTLIKTFYIESLGCAKNQVDAEALTGDLIQAGWKPMPTPEEAEYLLVNTCGFIEPAKQESIDVTLELRRRYPGKKIILTGCLSQRYGNELFQELKEVDGFFGNRNLGRITDLLDRVAAGGRSILIPEQYGPEPRRPLQVSVPGSTYVKIAEGCRNYCTYCAIPLIRGTLRSRTEEEVVQEIRDFLSLGVREITLIAQDLGSYGQDKGSKDGLTGLLRRIQKIKEDFWIRLLYIHPEHFPTGIIRLCQEDRRFLPYFDLPFQHGSSRILHAMGRHYTPEQNLELVTRIREHLPEAVLRSTFLVGFPGEGEEDFEDLLRFQSEARFEWLGVFCYSPEEGTPAAELDRKRRFHVPRKVALSRKKRLEEAQQKISEEQLDRFVGKQLKILVEEIVSGKELSLGRGYPHAPEVDGLVVSHGSTVLPGQWVTVQVIRRNGIDLEAVPLRGSVLEK